jgi:hypothetical protein
MCKIGGDRQDPDETSTQLYSMRFLITLTFTFILNLAYCQVADNTGQENETNIYYQTLIQFYNHNNYDKTRPVDTVYIEDDYKLTGHLLLKSERAHYVKVNPNDILHHYAQGKADISPLYRIYPLEYKEGFFYVPFSRIWAHYDMQTGKVNTKSIDSYKAKFKFKKGKFKLVNFIGTDL